MSDRRTRVIVLVVAVIAVIAVLIAGILVCRSGVLLARNQPTATPTKTPKPTFTLTATPTNTSIPTDTATPTSTATPTPVATNTPIVYTATPTPIPTETETPVPTATRVPPTNTPRPRPTNTKRPPTPRPPTNTPVPQYQWQAELIWDPAVAPNCAGPGISNISIIRDAANNPINGVRVELNCYNNIFLSHASGTPGEYEPGHYDFSLGQTQPQNWTCTARVFDINGQPVTTSEIATIQFDTNDCTIGGSGHQIAILNWTKKY